MVEIQEVNLDWSEEESFKSLKTLRLHTIGLHVWIEKVEYRVEECSLEIPLWLIKILVVPNLQMARPFKAGQALNWAFWSCPFSFCLCLYSFLERCFTFQRAFIFNQLFHTFSVFFLKKLIPTPLKKTLQTSSSFIQNYCISYFMSKEGNFIANWAMIRSNNQDEKFIACILNFLCGYYIFRVSTTRNSNAYRAIIGGLEVWHQIFTETYGGWIYPPNRHRNFGD